MEAKHMPRLSLPSLFTTVLLAVAVLSTTAPALADAAQETAAPARVSVTYVNPEKFTENRLFGMQDRFNHIDYLTELKDYLIKRGEKILAPGQHLHVNITDIRLAGAYEPSSGAQSDHIRMMRDVYPPRVDLDFQLTDQDGKVLREGKRVLRDLNYLRRNLSAPGARSGESLFYDKALLDSWLRGGPDKL
jgi:hypothetical protein